MVVFRELANRRFGVELEVSATRTKQDIGDYLLAFEIERGSNTMILVTNGKKGWAETHENNYWHVKYDSTCGPQGKGYDHGWEVASFIGCNSFDVVHIAEGAEHLRRQGVEVNRNCGLHVHVEIKDFDESRAGVLLAWWIKLENWLFSLCREDRRFNPYCGRLTDVLRHRCASYNKLSPESFWFSMRPHDLGTHDNYDKKVALNTVGFAGHLLLEGTRATAEIRMPECDLSYRHVYNWVAFAVHLINHLGTLQPPDDVSSVASVKEFITAVGLHGEDEFVLLDETLLSVKKWLLEKIAKSKNVRHAASAQNMLSLMG